MEPSVSVVLPCRDEERTIGVCIKKIKKVLSEKKIEGEIIVSDSSSDRSPEIARKLGATVISHGKKGYGIACLEAFAVAKGKYIIIGDADNTYDFDAIPDFVGALDDGYEFVIGSRMMGEIAPGAMPFLNRYVGNPLLSSILNLFFKTRISDTHSGFRAIRKDALDRLNLKTTGMEFASEMLILAAKNHLRMKEIPVSYGRRVGESKLSPISDGWRHLRFMLIYSPTYLYLIPGLFLFFLGFLLMIPMLFGTIYINGLDLGTPIMLFGGLLALLGNQVVSLGLYAKIYAIHTGFEKNDRLIDFVARNFPLEKGVSFGVLVVLFGVSVVGYLLFRLFITNSKQASVNFLLFAMTILVIGFHTIFSVFFMSMMLVEKKES